MNLCYVGPGRATALLRQAMSGDLEMPDDSVAHNSNSKEYENSINQARELCTEALRICDALELSPEIGARLEEVIAALVQSSSERPS